MNLSFLAEGGGLTRCWAQMWHLAEPRQRLRPRIKHGQHQVGLLLAVCLGVQHAEPLGSDRRNQRDYFPQSVTVAGDDFRCESLNQPLHTRRCLTPAGPLRPCPPLSSCHAAAHRSLDFCLPPDWQRAPPPAHLWLLHPRRRCLKVLNTVWATSRLRATTACVITALLRHDAIAMRFTWCSQHSNDLLESSTFPD